MEHTTWIHNIDPFLIHFSGNFGIRWYGLAYVTGFICCFLFMKWFSERKLSPLTVEQASDFLTYLILGVLLGGRLGYVLFYSPQMLTKFSSSFPFWEVLAVWKGGMASHGGFIGVLIACYIFSRRHKIAFLHLCDLTIMGAAIGIFFGRIANFVNGELFGKVSAPDFKWAVKFPQEIHRWMSYEPGKLYQLKDVAQTIDGDLSQWRVAQSASGFERNKYFESLYEKIIAQVQSGNQAVLDALQPILEPRHPSQLYAALTEGLIPMLVLFLLWRRKLKAGIIGAGFWIIYSMGRIFNEQFRLPDGHLSDLSKLPLGISRGQFLSLFLLAVGIGVMVWILRRKDDNKYGGWGQKSAD